MKTHTILFMSLLFLLVVCQPDATESIPNQRISPMDGMSLLLVPAGEFLTALTRVRLMKIPPTPSTWTVSGSTRPK